MKQLSYAEKLKSPNWQKKRLEILSLRGFKCEVCGDEENQIQVHHRFYLKGREPWQYDNDVFQVLCEKCHKSEHEKPQSKEIPKLYLDILDILDKWQSVDCEVPGSVLLLLQVLIEASPDRTYALLNNLSDISQSERLNHMIDHIVEYNERAQYECSLDVRLFEIERKLKLR